MLIFIYKALVDENKSSKGSQKDDVDDPSTRGLKLTKPTSSNKVQSKGTRNQGSPSLDSGTKGKERGLRVDAKLRRRSSMNLSPSM